ncbi:hypothetical protein Q8A67_025805 [Cirrhinus molitorella]|uniref:Uncharacterized protein n=1 Tax=Cirrhinus molitorella TaxID=172907 RepID=A0AA88TA09_9TELE|nr:hypothetical protein Q8A67_025805 [Cirrhinus molitorella]
MEETVISQGQPFAAEIRAKRPITDSDPCGGGGDVWEITAAHGDPLQDFISSCSTSCVLRNLLRSEPPDSDIRVKLNLNHFDLS